MGKKTVSGCIQYRSRVSAAVETGAVHPATIRAVPAATAWASSSSARTRTGAKSARAATRPSPRAAAVPPTAPGPSLGSPPVNTAVTFPASSVNLCEPDTEADAPELARRPARSVQSEIMRCQRAADPISGRARDPSGSSTNTAGAAVLGRAPAIGGWSSPPRRGGGGTGSDMRRSFSRSARASLRRVMGRGRGSKGSSRIGGLSTAGADTWRTGRRAMAAASFCTSRTTRSPSWRTRYARGSDEDRSTARRSRPLRSRTTAAAMACCADRSLASANWPKSLTTTTCSSSSITT